MLRGQDWIALLHVTDANPLPPNWQAFVPAGAAPTVETIAKVDALRTVSWKPEQGAGR